MGKNAITGIGLLWLLWIPAWGQGIVHGWITTETGAPIHAAEVRLWPGAKVQLSDQEGRFRFTQVPAGPIEVEVSMVGHEVLHQALTLAAGQEVVLNYQLQPLLDLETVIIYDEHAKQESMLATDHLSHTELQRNSRGTFVNALTRLPGIDAIQTGVGIAKPVIRGLSFNRVMVNDQGIKQEGQQWGADHGLEIDALAVSGVEILRGPTSLQYGSDGLGGVINVLPDPIPLPNTVGASLIAIGKSNNLHAGASAQVQVNKNDFWVSGRYTQQTFGDYRVPAESFVFQGFVLPIVDGYLKNTAGKEANVKVESGLRRKRSITRLTYSRYGLASGLFAGAVGIPRSYALNPDGNRRNIDLPSQSVQHDKVIANQLFLLDKSHLNLNIGYQQNLRREFGFPEFHNQPEIDPNDNLALQLDLRTLSGNLHLEQDRGNATKLVFGISAERQHNQSSGWDFLLPDFRLWRTGAFGLIDHQPVDKKIHWSAGLRADIGQNQSDFFQRYVWSSNGRIIDSLSVPTTNDLFANASASLGMRYEWVKEELWLKTHLGKSFRVPYPSETVSNGVHHGTFRHEKGSPDLRSEHGYQLDVILDWDRPRFRGELATYFNYFDNFIYLGPSGQLSTLPEAGQIYQYQQHDVFYSGWELSWEWTLLRKLKLHQAIDYVWNYNIQTTLALPFTPQPSMLTEIAWENAAPNIKGNGWFVRASHRYVWANGPNRVDRNERTTPAYQLVDALLGWQGEAINTQMEISLQGQNLLNSTYLHHLSRYRLIEVPEQGRNVVLSISMKWPGA